MEREELILHGSPVTTEEGAERVRTIRNQVRAYMTRNTGAIGPEEQALWWRDLDKSTHRLFLFDVEGWTGEQGFRTVAGYGLSRLIAGKWWLTGALANDWQGKGLGKELFSFLVKNAGAGATCCLEVREDNMRAFNTYKRLGFVEISRDSGIVTMVRRKP